MESWFTNEELKAMIRSFLKACPLDCREEAPVLFALSAQSVIEHRQAPVWASYYALWVLGRRWPEAEKIIRKSPFAAYHYGAYVIKDRWIEAEPIILRSPKWSFYYARDVLKRRWPEAESVIARSPRWSYWYDRYVIREKWPLPAGVSVDYCPVNICSL